jgi:GntR family transcriptional repressor for pyruvate dehydrogenase complex
MSGEQVARVRVNRETLAEQVARQLMETIRTERLRPGDQLPSEMRLAGEFGVSRPVIREALRHLAALRMVELANGKVPVVRPVTGDLLRVFFEWAVQVDGERWMELHELRRGVEGACAMLAAERRTDEDIAELHEVVEGMRGHLENDDRYAELDMRLHLAVARAAHNPLLAHLVESLSGAMRQVMRAGLGIIDQTLEMQRMQRAHETIVASICAGNAEAARLAMEKHLSGALANFEGAVRRP